MAGWNTPDDLKYAESDEWYRVEGDVITIGVTDYAQDQLSDVVYVELPEVGRQMKAAEAFGIVESVKSTSDLYTAVAGEVIEVNSTLEDTPETVNESPYEQGWFVKIKASDLSALDSLMDSTAYAEYCNSRN